MKKISKWLSVVALVSAAFTTNVQAQTEADFEKYVSDLKAEALSKGYDTKIVEQAFSHVVFKKKIVKADRNQPEFIETLETYLPKRVPQWKVDKARALYKEHKVLLEKIGQAYGVQPRFIVALWGLETNFGKIQGKYPLISSLVTLCFDGRRESFFKAQLWDALDILQIEKVPYEKLKGSWAGAMGQVQFMPSSFKAYAVDFDGDGVKDIWQNMGDVFASAANYLAHENWNKDLTWGRQVKVPENFDFNHAVPQKTRGRKHWLEEWKRTEKTLAEWQALGVRRADGSALPKANLKAAMMIPDGEDGRIYLAYDNYKSLMHWNRSYYFVTTVGYLSDRIAYPPVE